LNCGITAGADLQLLKVDQERNPSAVTIAHP